MDTTNGNAAPAGPDARRPRWGLLPEPGPDGRLDAATLLRYWFVEFNPLYFISAFCVLYGVFLIARNLDSLATLTPENAQLILFCVIQAYEALLIGGAAFLVHRAGALRPAVILALLEAVFLFDCTFRLEGLALIGPLAAPAILGAWLVLTLAKVAALGAVFRIRLPRQAVAAIVVTAAGIVAVILLLSRPDSNKVAILQLAALFGTGVLLMLEALRPILSSQLASGETQQQLAARCLQAAFRILAGAYFYHVWSYILLAATSDVRAATILTQAGSFFLYHALVCRRDNHVWVYGLLTLLSAMPDQSAVASALFVVAAAFSWRVWRGARAGLAVGAAFAAYGGVWLFGWSGGDFPPLPPILSWQTLALGAVLALIGWFLRDPLVWAMLGAGILYGAYRTLLPLVPKSELGLGVLLLGAGFLAFLIGIAVNWRFRDGREAKPPD